MSKRIEKKVFSVKHNDKNYLFLKPTLAYLSQLQKEKNKNSLDWTTILPIMSPNYNVLSICKKAFSKANLIRHSCFHGEPILIKEIANYFCRYGVSCNSDNVIIRQSIFNILSEIYELFNQKNVYVLIPTPTFGYYISQCQLHNLRTQLVPTKFENNWKITPEQLDKELKANKNIKIFLFNNPVNPTGVVYTKKDIISLSKVLKKYDVLIISDEVFKDLVFNKELNYSSFACIKELKERTVVLNGVGKTRGLSGLGVSFAYAPKWLCNKFHENKYLSLANIPAQIVATKSLEDSRTNKKFLNKVIKKHLKNLAFVQKQIELLNKKISQISIQDKVCVKLWIKNPEAVGVVMLEFQNLKGKKIDKKSVNSSLDLAKILRDECNLFLVPGEAFFMNGDKILLRMPIAYSKKELKEGFKRITKLFVKSNLN